MDSGKILRFRLGRLSRNRLRRSVTRRAVFRRGLVEENCFGAYHFRQLMALRAANILMRPAQREGGPFLVVEQRGLPFHAVVILGAAGYTLKGKLLAMGIIVAILAQLRSRLEVHVHQLGFEIGRLMAIDARRGTVRTQQCELCLGVIEARKFLPRFGGMACFAAGL